MLETSYNDWALISLSPLSFAAKVAIGIAVVLAALVVVWSYRQAKSRWALTFLRLAAALLVIGFVVEPAVQLRVVRRVRNRLPVIVDRSLSMSLATGEGTTRYDALLASLRQSQPALDGLAEDHVIELFDLDGPLARSRLDAAPDGQRTDLVGALEGAREAGSGKPLAGFVLLSDGADNAGLEAAGGQGLSAQAKDRLARLGAPVNTVVVGSDAGFRDVAITHLVADEFAFVHNTLDVEVEVGATGIRPVTLPVTLKRENEVVATQEVSVSAGETAHVSFKMKPDKIGDFLYSVSVAPVPGEALLANNNRTFALQVIRDKIRVLQVAGHPSWDERFLRQHLKEDPNVDLISFFILRTPNDAQVSSDSELSLIPFPTQKLFTTELASFDVVIFQNFDYRPYNMAPYLTNIRDAVLGGLGFVMVGGAQSFAGGGYGGTALEDLVALRVDGGVFRDGVAKPKLTSAGEAHPVTDLARGSRSNDDVWAALPAWETFDVTPGLMPGATALAVLPGVRTATGAPLPLIAVRDVGQGRSLAIATDDLWRWRFYAARDGGSSERAYHRFWSNALHWLVRDPQHGRVQVLPGKRRYEPGESVEIAFAVRGMDYQPVALAKIHVTLSEASRGAVRGEELTTSDHGGAELRLSDLEPGAYRVRAEARDASGSLGEASAIFLVDARAPELSHAAPRPDLLAAISRATGGKAQPSDAPWADHLNIAAPEAVEVDRRRNVELWDNGWALALAVLLLATEWALRRRRGYV